MTVNRRFTSIVLLGLALVSGCGVANQPTPTTVSNSAVGQQASDAHGSTTSMSLGDNPPFTIKINQDLARPAENWDATPVKNGLYDTVKVFDAKGQPVTLDVHNTPIFFEAYWCPHCQRTLVLLNANRSSLNKIPTIVSTGFAPNTSIQQAVYISDQEFSALNLNHFKVYYLLNQSLLSKYVVSYPTLAFDQKNQTEKFAGEHTLNLWEKALSDT